MELIQTFHFKSDFWGLILPMIFIGMDFLTGFVGAWIRKEVQSSKMRTGLGKKLGEVCVILIGTAITYGLDLPHQVMYFFCGYILIMEGISICENMAKLGVPLPAFITHALSDASKDLSTNTDVPTITDGKEKND